MKRFIEKAAFVLLIRVMRLNPWILVRSEYSIILER